MAFDSSRVIRPQPFPEDLLCAICTGVLQDPVEGPCEHLACRNCLDDWLQRSDSKTCPTCRQTLLPNAVKQAHRVIRNQLETLEVSCDNAARGCRAVLTLGALRNHVLSCGKAIESCPNDDCASALLREDVPKHLEVCPHRIVPCDRCDARIKHQDQEAHLQGACPAVEVRCQHNGGCGSMVPRGAMSSHIDIECTQGIMTWEVPGLEELVGPTHEWPVTCPESSEHITAAGEWGSPGRCLSLDPDTENGNECEYEDEFDDDFEDGNDDRVLQLLMASSSTTGNGGAVGGQHGPGSKGKGWGGHAEGEGGRGVTAKAGAVTSKGNKVKGKEQEMGRGGQGQGRRADARSLRATGKAKKCRPFVPVLEAEIEEESLVHARGDAGYDELGVQLGGGRGEAEGVDEAEARRREARAAMERAEQRRRKGAEKAARWEARREAKGAALVQKEAPANSTRDPPNSTSERATDDSPRSAHTSTRACLPSAQAPPRDSPRSSHSAEVTPLPLHARFNPTEEMALDMLARAGAFDGFYRRSSRPRDVGELKKEMANAAARVAAVRAARERRSARDPARGERRELFWLASFVGLAVFIVVFVEIAVSMFGS